MRFLSFCIFIFRYSVLVHKMLILSHFLDIVTSNIFDQIVGIFVHQDC